MNTNKLIFTLGNNLEKLTRTYADVMAKSDYNAGLNVLKNIDMVVKQLKELDFVTMKSKYSTKDETTGKMVKELAIWEQNGFCQIKNHERFRIEPTGNKINFVEDNFGSIQGIVKFNDETINEIVTLVCEKIALV